MIPFPDATARPQASLIPAAEKGASTIRAATVTPANIDSLPETAGGRHG